MIPEKDLRAMRDRFAKNFQGMVDLVARGRGIEILLRVADQTSDTLTTARKSYDAMMAAATKAENRHPPKALPRLFADTKVRDRLEAARDIGDKLAHGLYRQARKLIDTYSKTYGIKTKLKSDGTPGWRIDADGHLVEADGRKIKSIVDILKTSDDNLIYEEYLVFVADNYSDAAREIFADAWKTIGAAQGPLALNVSQLAMFRSFKRGRREYVK